MTRAIVVDNVDSRCAELLKKYGIEVVTVSPNVKPDTLTPADAVVIRSKPKFTVDYIDAAKPRIIARAGIGVDNIDTEYATEQGIAVVNTPFGSTNAVAEYIFGAMLSLYRHFPQADMLTKAGEWPRGQFEGRELGGRQMGFVGLGNIGKNLTKKAAGFDMDIAFFDPYVSEYRDAKRYEKLEDLFSESDFVSLHIPLTQETRGVITRELLETLKEGAVFLNSSRAEVVEEGALKYVMKERPDINAALDVHYLEERGEQTMAQFGDRVILTPHIAGTTKEAQERCAQSAAEQIKEFFETGKARHWVNGYNIPDDLSGYMQLARKLGYIASRFVQNPVRIEFTCYNGLADYEDALRRAVIAGALQDCGEFVNELNAGMVAERIGLDVRSRKGTADKQYGNSITVDLIANGEDVSLRGARSWEDETGHTDVLRSIGHYSRDATTKPDFYLEGGFPLKGDVAIIIYDEVKGAARVITGLTTDKDLDIAYTVQGKSGDRGKAVYCMRLEGPDTDRVFDSILRSGYIEVDGKYKVHKAITVQL